MRRLWIAVACLAMAGCDRLMDKPVVSGCEDYIKSRLAAPSTYKRLEVQEDDETMPYGDLVKLGMPDHSDTLALYLHEKPEPNRLSKPANLHKVFVTYQANNGFNAPLRDELVCGFAAPKDALPDKHSVESNVSSAKLDDLLREEVRREMRPDDGSVNMDPHYLCCLK